VLTWCRRRSKRERDQTRVPHTRDVEPACHLVEYPARQSYTPRYRTRPVQSHDNTVSTSLHSTDRWVNSRMFPGKICILDENFFTWQINKTQYLHCCLHCTLNNQKCYHDMRKKCVKCFCGQGFIRSGPHGRAAYSASPDLLPRFISCVESPIRLLLESHKFLLHNTANTVEWTVIRAVKGYVSQIIKFANVFFSFFISFCICSVSTDNVGTDVRWAGNLNGQLMASYVRNVYTKNYYNLDYSSPSYYQ